jgi:hypothetical protein
MKTAKRILTAILATLVLVAPQFAALVPAKFQIYAYVVLIIYDITARLVPTYKNWSIVGQFIVLIKTLFPNQSKTFTQHD